MDIFDSNAIMSFFLGIGLSASVGFRVFLPLIAVSDDAHFRQDLLQLNEIWRWIGSWPAIITLGMATVVEILAYYIPFIDNFLDTIVVPLATVAKTILIGSTLLDMGDAARWGFVSFILVIILLYGIYQLWKCVIKQENFNQ